MHRPNKKINMPLRWTLLLFAALSISACGQKGNLYLPDENQASSTALSQAYTT